MSVLKQSFWHNSFPWTLGNFCFTLKQTWPFLQSKRLGNTVDHYLNYCHLGVSLISKGEKLNTVLIIYLQFTAYWSLWLTLTAWSYLFYLSSLHSIYLLNASSKVKVLWILNYYIFPLTCYCEITNLIFDPIYNWRGLPSAGRKILLQCRRPWLDSWVGKG